MILDVPPSVISNDNLFLNIFMKDFFFLVWNCFFGHFLMFSFFMLPNVFSTLSSVFFMRHNVPCHFPIGAQHLFIVFQCFANATWCCPIVV